MNLPLFYRQMQQYKPMVGILFGKNINQWTKIYRQQLELYNSGICTFDANSNSIFNLKIVTSAAMGDLPGLAEFLLRTLSSAKSGCKLTYITCDIP